MLLYQIFQQHVWTSNPEFSDGIYRTILPAEFFKPRKMSNIPFAPLNKQGVHMNEKTQSRPSHL